MVLCKALSLTSQPWSLLFWSLSQELHGPFPYPETIIVSLENRVLQGPEAVLFSLGKTQVSLAFSVASIFGTDWWGHTQRVADVPFSSIPKDRESSQSCIFLQKVCLQWKLWLTVSWLDRTQICLNVTSSAGSSPSSFFNFLFWTSSSSHKGTS